MAVSELGLAPILSSTAIVNNLYRKLKGHIKFSFSNDLMLYITHFYQNVTKGLQVKLEELSERSAWPGPISYDKGVKVDSDSAYLVTWKLVFY